MHLHSCRHQRKAYNACHKVNVDYIFQITGCKYTIVLKSYSLAVDFQVFQSHFVFLKIGSLLTVLIPFFTPIQILYTISVTFHSVSRKWTCPEWWQKTNSTGYSPWQLSFPAWDHTLGQKPHGFGFPNAKTHKLWQINMNG